MLTLCNSLDGRTESSSDSEWTWSGGLSEEEVEAEQARRCTVVRSALNHDISKCVIEGRSLLIEGSELDCSLYSHGALDTLKAAQPPACIILAFVLSVDSNEQRILLHDSLSSTNAPGRCSGEACGTNATMDGQAGGTTAAGMAEMEGRR